MKITVLGCGSSLGVPALSYGWGDCNPSNPKNRRTRSSIIIEDNDSTLLVDMSPDLRNQLLECHKEIIDAVLFTHSHYDHVNGINEMRPICLNNKTTLDIFALEETLSEISHMFSYLFETNKHVIYRPYLCAHKIQEGKFNIKNIEGICFRQNHGFSSSLGFRIKNFAYSTDIMELDKNMVKNLQNLDVWIVDCLSFKEARPTHANLPTVLKWVEQIKPKKTYLTHMDTSMDYDTLVKILPNYIAPAYDQLVIEL